MSPKLIELLIKMKPPRSKSRRFQLNMYEGANYLANASALVASNFSLMSSITSFTE